MEDFSSAAGLPHLIHPSPWAATNHLQHPERPEEQVTFCFQVFSAFTSPLRSGKYYPATFSHAPLELRPIKMKKSMKKSLGTGVVTREPGKMYTWSPYTSNLFYTEPSGESILGSSERCLTLAPAGRCQGVSSTFTGPDCVIKTTDELRF